MNDDAAYAKLDEISQVLQPLEQKAYEAGDIANQLGDERLFLRTEIVRLALSLADDLTNYQHMNVERQAERLLEAAQLFYSPESR